MLMNVLQRLLVPALLLTNRLTYTKKFFLIGLINFVALSVLLYSAYNTYNHTVNTAQRELEGIALMQPIFTTVQSQQKHRGLDSVLSLPIHVLQHEHDVVETQARHAMAQLEQILPVDIKQNSTAWRYIQTSWDGAQTRHKNDRQWNEGFVVHTHIVKQLLYFASDIMDVFGASSDAENDTHYLMQSAVITVPEALEHMGQIRAYSLSILTRKQMNESQSVVLYEKIALLRSSIENLKVDIEKTAHYNPILQAELSSMVIEMEQLSENIIKTVEQDIFSKQFAIAPEDFYTQVTAVIDKGYQQIFQHLLPTARVLIHHRVEEAKERFVWVFGLTVLIFALALYVLLAIYVGLNRNIQALARSAQYFSEGNLDARVEVESVDELNQVGRSFNQMVAGFQSLLIQQQESRERLSVTVETSMEAFINMDSEGYVVEWNKQAEIIFGWQRGEVIGQYLHEIIIPHRFREAHLSGIQRYLHTGEGPVLHKRMKIFGLRKNGQEFPIELTIAPVNASGQVSFSAFIEDITERENAERAMLAASQAKSDFLANMSHEIRTPMNGIVGMMDILQQSQLDENQLSMMNTIQESSLALLSILNDILDFSKIEAGKLAIENIPVFLREPIEGASQLLMTMAHNKAVDLEVFVSPALPAWVTLDPTRLRQILLNLIGNAIKFTAGKEGGQGRVLIRVESTTLKGQPAMSFCVIDNGIGMSAETLDKLFKPFTQADVSTSRHFGGTGLGLSITQRLAELMGGQISVSSTAGEATEFCVLLPLIPAQANREVLDSPRIEGVNVLLLTRNSLRAEILQAYCRAGGATVEIYTDASSLAQSASLSAADGQKCVVLLDENEVCPEHVLQQCGVAQLIRRGSDLSICKHTAVFCSPLFLQDLLYGLRIAALGGSSGQVAPIERRRQIRRVAPTVEQALAEGRLILLAEDNATNRKVILEQLKVLGYAAEAAEDGEQALQMWRSGRYALLLTDCHMPKLDGYELAVAIRQEEPAGQRFTIVAVTANALRGEAEHCIACGMDDYLSKPLRLNELGNMLIKWLPLPPQPAAELNKVVTNDSLPVWRAQALSEMVGDDKAMQREILDMFLADVEKNQSKISAAMETGDWLQVGKAAHAFKSAARTVGAMQLGDLCQRLEQAGKGQDSDACQALFAELNETVMAATTEIKQTL